MSAYTPLAFDYNPYSPKQPEPAQVQLDSEGFAKGGPGSPKPPQKPIAYPAYDIKSGDAAYGSDYGHAYVRHSDGSWTTYTVLSDPSLGVHWEGPKVQNFPSGSPVAILLDKKVVTKKITFLEGAVPGLETPASHGKEKEDTLPPMPNKLAAKDAPLSVTKFVHGNDFTHPVSGTYVHIGEGETLMQHNSSLYSFLVLNPDGSMKTKIDINGKVQKAGTNLKLSNYHEIFNHKTPPPFPGPKSAKSDFPVYGSANEIGAALHELPVGAKLSIPQFGYEAVKTDKGWKTNAESLLSSAFLAGVITAWSNDAKDCLQVDPGAPKLNKQGIPTYDKQAFLKWANSLPVGTVVGTQKAAFGTKKPASATKTGADEWTDDASFKEINTEGLASAIVANKKGKAEEFEVKSTPSAKTKASGNVSGSPTEEIVGETGFQSYAKYKLPNHLNKAFTGSNGKVEAAWHQQDFVYHLSSYTPENIIAALAKDELGVAISDAVATIEHAKKNADLPIGTKAKASKLVKKLNELAKYHQAAKILGKGELPDEHPVDGDFVWGNSATWAFDMSSIKNALQKSWSAATFKKDSESLGWDPYNGTHEQYKEYLSNTGSASWSGYLGLPQAKSLALHYMNAPGSHLSDHPISSLKAQAWKTMVIGQIDDFLESGEELPEFPGTPSFMEDHDWQIVRGLLSGKLKFDFPKDSLSSENHLKQTFGHLRTVIPDEVSKALGGYFTSVDSSAILFRQTILHLLKSGIWNGDSLTYTHPVFGEVPVTPGMDVTKYDGRTFFFPKGFEGGDYITSITSYGDIKMVYMYPSELGTFKSDLIYTAPYKVTLKDSQQDGHTFSVYDWSFIELVEDTDLPFSDFTGQQLMGIKSAIGPSAKVSSLSDRAKTLISLYPSYAQIIAYKDQKGHYRVDDKPVDPVFATEWEAILAKPDVPEPLIKVGSEEDPDDIYELLDESYSSEMVKTFKWLTGSSWVPVGDYDDVFAAVRDKITELQASKVANEVDEPAVAKFGTLHEVPDQGLGGSRPKIYFVDDDGDLYMAKHDNKNKFRVDSEYAAVEIAKMFGFGVPEAVIREIGSKYCYVQRVLPAAENLFDMAPSDLDDSQLIEVMSGHPLDWALSQHDTHGGHLLLQPNGKLLKIDLGQAFKFLGKDQLVVGYQPEGNFDPVWYDRFYREVQEGKVDKARLDKVTKAVLVKSSRIATTKDSLYQKYVELAFSHRKGPTKPFLAKAMQRKHQTFEDFFNFYKGLYAEGGYDFEFSEDLFDQSSLEGTAIHLSPSPAFAEQLLFVKAHGKSLFFASPEIEDAHALFYVSQSKKGSNTLRADMKIRTNGDAAIKAWIKAQGVSIAPNVAASQASSGFSDSVTNKALEFLIAFAKTVSVHQEDGQYNQSTVAAAEQSLKDVEYRLNQIKIGWGNDPLYRHPTFETGHQQWAWVEWAEKTVNEFVAVKSAMQTSQKSPMVAAPISYDPPQGIVVSKAPKAIETVELDGIIYTKYNDHTYIVDSIQISPQTYEIFKGEKGAVTTDLTTKEETTQVVAAPVYGVSSTNFKTPRFEAIKDDGTLIEKGAQGFDPDAYDIVSSEHPDIKLHYFPHQDAMFDKTNEGRLLIAVENWDGDYSAIDRAMGMVNDMGIDTSPADETSLKLFYWRHLAGILGQRKLNSKASKALTAMKVVESKVAEMSADDEIEARMEVFASLWGQDVVEGAEWRPQIGHIAKHMNPAGDDVTAGRPRWLRPDFKVKDAQKYTSGILPGRQDSYALTYLFSGVYAASEEKVRYRGWFGDGSEANSPQADRSYGSGQFGFLRQGQYISGYGIYVEPKVLALTSNFAFDQDHYGNIQTRNKKSPFDLGDSAALGSQGGGFSSNELMFKYGLSTWDDIAIIQASSSSQRAAVIKKFKDAGLSLVRGIAIEERVVMSKSEAQAAMQKVWAQAAKEELDE